MTPNEIRSATSTRRAPQTAPPGDSARRARIAIAAYYRAERRGFAPGHEIEDWLEAEREVDQAAAAAAPAPETAALLTSKPSTPAESTTKAKAPKSRGGAERTGRR